jgi:hypothetical protein
MKLTIRPCVVRQCAEKSKLTLSPRFWHPWHWNLFKFLPISDDQQGNNKKTNPRSQLIDTCQSIYRSNKATVFDFFLGCFSFRFIFLWPNPQYTNHHLAFSVVVYEWEVTGTSFFDYRVGFCLAVQLIPVTRIEQFKCFSRAQDIWFYVQQYSLLL